MTTMNIHHVTAIGAGNISERTLPSGALYWRRTITVTHNGHKMALTLFSDESDTSLGVDNGDAHEADRWCMVASEENARADELEQELADARNAHLDVLRDINLVREELGVGVGPVSGEELVDKIREREQALEAHVERLTRYAKEARLCLDHARVFISTRQKMHECGRDAHDECLACLTQTLEDAPTTSLARRDKIKQAEALEVAAAVITGGMMTGEKSVNYLERVTKELRQQAEGA